MNQRPSFLRSLRELSRLEPDTASISRAIGRARATVVKQSTPKPSLQWRRIMSPRNVTAAAVALAVVLLLTLWLSPLGSTNGLAFAEVQDKVEKTKSVQFTETRQDKSPDGKLAGPKSVSRVMILGCYLRREETKVVYAGDKLEEGRHWTRGPDHVISITNAKTGERVSLLPEERLFSVTKRIAWITPDDGKIHTGEIEPQPEADFYSEIRRVPAEKAEKLRERAIDGNRAVGFRVVDKTKRKQGTDTFTTTYWVDPKTKLPMRIESSFRSTDPTMGQSEALRNEFVFDAPLDKTLFSTEPPKGYVDQERPERGDHPGTDTPDM